MSDGWRGGVLCIYWVGELEGPRRFWALHLDMNRCIHG